MTLNSRLTPSVYRFSKTLMVAEEIRIVRAKDPKHSNTHKEISAKMNESIFCTFISPGT